MVSMQGAAGADLPMHNLAGGAGLGGVLSKVGKQTRTAVGGAGCKSGLHCMPREHARFAQPPQLHRPSSRQALGGGSLGSQAVRLAGHHLGALQKGSEGHANRNEGHANSLGGLVC